MKRILSFSLLAVMATSAYSQTLWSDNFNSYATGNLGTKGGWERDGGTNGMAKVAVVNSATYANSFQFASTAANEDGMWIFHTFDWDTRTAGNDTFVAEYAVYTGSAYAETQVYDVSGGYYQIGDILFDVTDGVGTFSSQADFDGDTGQDITGLTVTANTWYKVKMTYNTTDGTTMLNINGTNYGPFVNEGGLIPGELDMVSSDINNSGYDNFVMSAAPTLAVSDVAHKSAVSVYPNPTTGVINVKSENKIAQVSIYDISGKAVKITTETSINVENLANGSYLVSIKYADGTIESKKVIKK